VESAPPNTVMSEAEHTHLIRDQFTRQAAPFSAAASIRNEDALERIVRMAGAGGDDTVLDVACGPGLLACAFAPVVRRVTGVDVTPAMLEQARALQSYKGLSNLTWDLAEAPPLPYPDRQFSIVTCRFSFHHMLDPLAVLREMRRVCSRDGRVVVADMTPVAAKAEAFHMAEKLRDPSHVRALPQQELLGLFERAGLGEIRTEKYRLENELEDVLSRSFPAPGDADRLRQIYANSIADDALGIGTRRDGDQIRFALPITIVAAHP
jgi:ubiquinone/menaquinone biosynthesis C-methylase UbiE